MQHLMAIPVLDRGGAADRLRNHLRRRAITRVGLIEGDLYMLPFWRAGGLGPGREEAFHLLAAEMGDPRLRRPNLLPADLKPFDASTLPPGAVVVRAEPVTAPAARRGAALGWRADRFDHLVHYPFWMMRVEDSGRIEGAWIDGIEGRVIVHSLKVPPPAPSLGESALALAPSALAMALADLIPGTAGRLAASAAVFAAAAPILALWFASRARRERQG